MYELIQVSENDYYIQSPAKIGLVRLNDQDVCLIDSGNDENAGRKVRQILENNNWHLKAIYNTHSNADHTGGNHYLQKYYGCKIYAPGIELDFTKHPILEPSFVYGGYPCSDLRHKFLLADACEVEELTPDVLPEGMTMFPLPGHFFDMVAFRTKDDTVYLADCICSEQTLQKYQITFVYDVAAYLQTLEAIKSFKAKIFVPAHTEPASDFTDLAQYNIEKVWEIANTILDFCKEGINFEALLQKLFNHYNLRMSFAQYALVGSTVRSYLSWLKDTGRLTVEFENNMLLWKRI